MKKFFQFVLAMVLSFAPGVVGAVFSPNGPSDVWYNALNKSVLNPDGWVFGVAWTILYILLGIAFFLIISNTKSKQKKTAAYWLFFANMVLNALWSYVFFGMQLATAGVIIIALLILISFWMMRSFAEFNKAASYLVIPYILWLAFALYLNGMIVYLN